MRFHVQNSSLLAPKVVHVLFPYFKKTSIAHLFLLHQTTQFKYSHRPNIYYYSYIPLKRVQYTLPVSSPLANSNFSFNFFFTDRTDMLSLETATRSIEPKSGPRISFSADEKNLSISPNSQAEKKCENEINAAEFEFLSSNFTSGNMTTADELIFDGKLLPYWQTHHAEKLNKISLKTEEIMIETEVKSKEEINRPTNWFIDEDPSPRPPTCNVLWKELLRLKKQKQRPSSLSPSSSSSNSEISTTDESKEKHVNKIKKRLERSRSATISVRPLINVPICAQAKNNALPPLFSLKKGRLER